MSWTLIKPGNESSLEARKNLKFHTRFHNEKQKRRIQISAVRLPKKTEVYTKQYLL